MKDKTKKTLIPLFSSTHRISTDCKQTMSVLQIKMVYENIEKVKRETRDWFNEFIPSSHLSAFRYIVPHKVYDPPLGISSTVRFIVSRYVYYPPLGLLSVVKYFFPPLGILSTVWYIFHRLIYCPPIDIFYTVWYIVHCLIYCPPIDILSTVWYIVHRLIYCTLFDILSTARGFVHLGFFPPLGTLSAVRFIVRCSVVTW